MRLFNNLEKWSSRVKNAVVASMFLAAYSISAVAPFIPKAYAAGLITSNNHQGQNTDGTWTSGNTTLYSEGDYVNFRFTLTASDAASGQMLVIFSNKASGCSQFFTNYFALGSVTPAGIATVNTVGSPISVASGGNNSQWQQPLDLNFTAAGTVTVVYTLRYSNTAGDCNGSSTHTLMGSPDNPGDYSNTGAQSIPLPGSGILYAPSLTLTKIVDGGSAVASDFSFTVSPAINGVSTYYIPATTSATGSVVIPDINPDGTYVITEHGPAGYTFSGGTGTNCSTTSPGVMAATVTAGRPAINAACTFTNTIQKGSITIVKDAAPNSPQDFSFTTTGAGLAGFSLDDDSDTTLSNTKTFTNLIPGTFSVTETVTDGWDLSGIVCSGGGTQVSGATVSITLAPGANVLCTYTNRQHGRIIVNKVTNPANDTTPFSVTASGSGAIVGGVTRSLTTLQPVTYEVSQGTYSVAETVPAGWTQTSSTCQSVTIDSSTPLIDGIPTVSCTITNTKLAKLKIAKGALPNDSQDFSFTTSGTGLSNFSLDDDDDATLSNVKEFVDLMPGTYTVNEASTAGWQLTGLNCNTNNFTVSGAQVSVVLSAGQETTCIFTNTKLGSLSGTKYEVNADGSTVKVEPNGWLITLFENGTSTGLTQTTDGSGNYTFSGLLPGNYSVMETPLSGWTQIYSPLSAVSLSAGQEIANQNFGNFKNGSIAGYKFNDHNGNGSEDEGDEHLAGWTMTLFKEIDGEKVQVGNSVSTDGEGNYSFDNLAPGTYWVCETSQSGWVQTFPANNGCHEIVIDLSGETNSGTNFGNQGRGTITVKKNVDSNGDGTVDYWNVGDWTWDLGDANFATGTTQSVEAGGYTIHEDQKENYHFTLVECNEEKYAQAESVSVYVAPGENVVCTFTNTRDTGFIKVQKEIFPEDDDGLFDLSVDETVVKENASDGDDSGWVRVVTGTHEISEVAGTGTDMSNYDSMYMCWKNYEMSDPNAQFDWVNGEGTSTEVSVSKGLYIVCSFYNERHGELTVVKDAQPNDSQDFAFTLTPINPKEEKSADSDLQRERLNFSALETNESNEERFDGTFWLDDDSDETLSNEQNFEMSGGWYTVKETAVEGWDLTGIECDTENPPYYEMVEEPGTVLVWIEPGVHTTCTFTNVKRASVTITKDAQPNFAQPFTFTTDLSGEESSFNLTDDGVNASLASKTFGGVVPGTYTVTESAVAGWTLNEVRCTGAEVIRDGAKVTLEVEPGAAVSCTYVNHKNTIPQVLGSVDPPKLVNTGSSIWTAVFMSLTVIGLAVLTSIHGRRRIHSATSI